MPLYLANMFLMLGVLMEEPSGSTVDVSGIITALAGTITPAQVATLMASIVGAGALIYLTWVFGRKAIRAFYKAVRGKAPTA